MIAICYCFGYTNIEINLLEVTLMKTALKILSALAAIAGVVYVVATYGDKIVAWAKKILASVPNCDCEVVEEEAPVEEAAPAEEAPVEESPVEEAAPVEIVIEDNEPVADDADFEG